MEQRNIIILILCVLAGYFIHLALKYGFNINLVESICIPDPTQYDLPDDVSEFRNEQERCDALSNDRRLCKKEECVFDPGVEDRDQLLDIGKSPTSAVT